MKRRRGITPHIRDGWIQSWQRQLNEGAYAPFHRTEDVPSKGARYRVKGVRSGGRVHHLMSHNELLMFCALEHDSRTAGIWEQYALLPLAMTVAVAEFLGYQHPRYPGSAGRPLAVMTTDFLVREVDGSHRAYSVKQAGALSNRRTAEKQAIEQGFWLAQGVPWQLVTSDRLRTQYHENLTLLHRYAAPGRDVEDRAPEWLSIFRHLLNAAPTERLATLLRQSAVMLNLRYGDAAALLYHSIWWGRIDFDLSRPIRLDAAAWTVMEAVNAWH